MARTQTIRAPWERSRKSRMLLVHFDIDELEALDSLQGGPSVDDATGYREYSKLSKIIKIPQVKKIVYEVQRAVVKDLSDDGKLNGPLKKAYKQSRKKLSPYQKTTAESFNPVAKKLEKTGTHGDTKLAWIPQDVAAFLIDINQGHFQTNPHTGLLMFGFFSSLGKVFKPVFRIAAPIIAVAAAPWTGGTSLAALAATGATAAGASYLAHRAIGASHKESMGPTVISGLTAGLAPGISEYTGLNPSLIQGLTRAGSGMLMGENLGQAAMSGLTHGGAHYGMGQLGEAGYLPSWMQGSSPGVKGALSGAEQGLSSSAIAAKAVADRAAGVAAPGLFGSLGNMLGGSSNLLLPMAMAGLSYQGSKQRHKHELDQQREAIAREDAHRQRLGYNDPWVPVKAKDIKVRKNPAFYDAPREAMERGVHDRPWLYEGDPGFEQGLEAGYKAGGNVRAKDINPRGYDQNKLQSVVEGVLIRGPGKGQQDLIKTTVPENSYIIDASSTGMFGDGSSDAGAKVLKEFEEQIKSRCPKHKAIQIYHHTKSSTKQLPVYLSDSEYKFDPITVTMLGKGSNTQGAVMLKHMVNNLRAHKALKGGGLPPKAKSPWAYIEGRVH